MVRGKKARKDFNIKKLQYQADNGDICTPYVEPHTDEDNNVDLRIYGWNLYDILTHTYQKKTGKELNWDNMSKLDSGFLDKWNTWWQNCLNNEQVSSNKYKRDPYAKRGLHNRSSQWGDFTTI